MADPSHPASPLALPPCVTCQVFPAEVFSVRAGANLGDPLGDLDTLCLGDVYQLAAGANALRLNIAASDACVDKRRQPIAAGSDVGRPGGWVALCARLTLMAPEGDMVELLLLCPDGPGGLYALPLSPMEPKVDYTLIRAEADPGTARLSDLVCISFGRGTMIALADGSQIPIEGLKAGDRVLTRDHGAQPLRWIGRATLRALGSYAPIVITAGTLGNAGDLIVGQHHRMFLYQRDRNRLADTAELLVQAKHLVDGERVFLRQGGYVDYFSLIFDQHEIIYVEGIPAESLMVNDATLSRLPDALAEELRTRFPGLSQRQHFGTEAGRRALTMLGGPAFFQQRKAG